MPEENPIEPTTTEGEQPTEEPTTPAAEPPEEKTFKQEDVDRIVSERLKREREKYADYEALKAKAAEAESDQERLVREAREEAANEVKANYHQRAIRDAAKAAAAGKWVKPEHATQLVDLTDLDPDAEDFESEVTQRLDDYLAENPNLAVGDRQPVPGADQGARGGNGASQLTRDQLKNMTPDEITKAKAEGRLDKLLGR